MDDTEKESIISFRMSYSSKGTDVLVRSCSVWLDCMPSLGPTSAVRFTKVGKESTRRAEVGDYKRKGLSHKLRYPSPEQFWELEVSYHS